MQDSIHQSVQRLAISFGMDRHNTDPVTLLYGLKIVNYIKKVRIRRKNKLLQNLKSFNRYNAIVKV